MCATYPLLRMHASPCRRACIRGCRGEAGQADCEARGGGRGRGRAAGRGGVRLPAQRGAGLIAGENRCSIAALNVALLGLCVSAVPKGVSTACPESCAACIAAKLSSTPAECCRVVQSMLLGKASVVLGGGAVFVTLNYQASKHVEQYYRDQVRDACSVRAGSDGRMAHGCACALQLRQHSDRQCGWPSSRACQTHQVYHTLERGFCPEPLAGEEELLPRRRLRERLLTMLGQEEPAKCYYLITGQEPWNHLAPPHRKSSRTCCRVRCTCCCRLQDH